VRARSRERARLVVASARSLARASSVQARPAASAVPSPQRRTRLRGLDGALTRALDVALSTVLLIVAAPLFVLVAVAIRLDSPGPVFFCQSRVGLGGREFTMVKFRSMESGAPPEPHQSYIKALASAPAVGADGQLQKLTEDVRVTLVGAILRKTSIDEIPQLINVLAGRMSIVGPRPAVAYELEFYRPEHLERFGVRPGITGLWQVSGRNRLGFYEMLELDLEYVRCHSFAYDLRLLLRTPWAVLSADTA